MTRSLFLTLCIAGTAAAQTADSPPRPAQAAEDSIVARARQLDAEGNSADSRKLLDSLLSVTPSDHPRYADALYWRAALSTTAADAERDYSRLLIEAPLSPRAEDALLQLAQLEQARGDRRGASDHLQRFMLSYPDNPARPRVAVSLVRLLFEQGPQQVARACDALRSARSEVPVTNAELRNQLEFFAPRCQLAETPLPQAVDSQRLASDSTRPSTSAPTAAPAQRDDSPRSAFYSVQVAAYETHDAADRLARELVSRGLTARVDGTATPFRVRVGRYSTRADAVKAATELKGQGHVGFVVLVRP